MEKNGKTAVDIIHELPGLLARLEGRLASIEARFAVLELKTAQSVVQAPPPSPKNASPTMTVEEDDDEVQDMPPPPAPKVRTEAPVQSMPIPPPPPVPTQVKPESLSIPHEHINVFPDNPQRPDERSATATHVFGKLKDPRNGPLIGVSVKISQPDTKFVKNTRTSSSGEWLAMLQSGEYVAEFTKAGMTSFFKTITIPPGLKKLEVK